MADTITTTRQKQIGGIFHFFAYCFIEYSVWMHVCAAPPLRLYARVGRLVLVRCYCCLWLLSTSTLFLLFFS